MFLRLVAVFALSASVGQPLAEAIFSEEHGCCAAPCPGEDEDAGSRPFGDDCSCCLLGGALTAAVRPDALRPPASVRIAIADPGASDEPRAFATNVYRPPRA